MKRTKIICTLGPTVSGPANIEKLVKLGMNVARINMSHGSIEQHLATIRQLKEINKKLDASGKYPNSIAIMLDTKGAEARTGVVEKPLSIKVGEEVIFTSDPDYKDTRQVLVVNYDGFGKDVRDAEQILLDNGKMSFELLKVNKDGSVLTKSNDEGTVGSRRHVNLPGASLSMPSLTDQDWKAIEVGANEGVDFVALSFIREASEVEEVRAFLKKRGKHMELISKMETRQSVENMREIIEASDGIMVARGDLGAEVAFEKIPVIQDELVSLTREAGKPVIVATHMLESMIESPMPTRAEVTDIAHAAMSGADCTMLSGETASGKYPFRSLDAMVRVLEATEKHMESLQPRMQMSALDERDAQADSAVSLALSCNAKAIVVMTKKGKSARDVARYRPIVPVIACTPDDAVQRALQLSYGVIPVLVSFAKDPEKTVAEALKTIAAMKLLKKNDTVVLVSDARAHNDNVSTIQVRQIP